ncbi:MAG: hypothetical protein R3C99_24975 [Pirellulaceae bacterium]
MINAVHVFHKLGRTEVKDAATAVMWWPWWGSTTLILATRFVQRNSGRCHATVDEPTLEMIFRLTVLRSPAAKAACDDAAKASVCIES